jgi:hypothetical protein
VLLGLSLGLLLAQEQPKPAPPDAQANEFKPQWQKGQKWVVETLTNQLQARRDPAVGQGKKPVPIQWQFEVQDVEKVDGKDCYKVQIQCQVKNRTQPVTTIWTNAKSMTLQQLQTQFPVQGGFRTVTEHYQSTGKPAPVLAPLTVLPLELPVFLPEETKSLTPMKFSYEAVSGPSGTKAVGDVGFIYDVEQDMERITPEEAKGLLADDFSKGLESVPMLRIKIKGPRNDVTQIWQPRQPWPVYSNNGPTTARLIKVIPPPKP